MITTLYYHDEHEEIWVSQAFTLRGLTAVAHNNANFVIHVEKKDGGWGGQLCLVAPGSADPNLLLQALQHLEIEFQADQEDLSVALYKNDNKYLLSNLAHESREKVVEKLIQYISKWHERLDELSVIIQSADLSGKRAVGSKLIRIQEQDKKESENAD